MNIWSRLLLILLMLLPIMAEAAKIHPYRYDMPNGIRWGSTNFFDNSYNGLGDKESNYSQLSEGVGDLTDGIADPAMNLRADYTDSKPHVCWTGRDPDITFYFNKVRDFKTLRIDMPDCYLCLSHLAKAIKVDITIEGETKSIDLTKAEEVRFTREWYEFDLSDMKATNKIAIKMYRNQDRLEHPPRGFYSKVLMCTSEIEFYDGASRLKINDTPITLEANISPNVMLVLDNSQSMDAYMDGTPTAGFVSQDRSAVWSYFEDFEDFNAYKTASEPNNWYGQGRFENCPGCAAEWSGAGQIESTADFFDYGMGRWHWRNASAATPRNCQMQPYSWDGLGTCTQFAEATTLTLKNVPPHQELFITFTLLLWDSIDGGRLETFWDNGISYAEDRFQMTMNDKRLFNDYFYRTWPTPQQVVDDPRIKYTHRYMYHKSVDMRFDNNNTGGPTAKKMGYNNHFRDRYKTVTLQLANIQTTTRDMVLTFRHPNSQGGMDESFGIDNILITATNDSNDPDAPGLQTRSNLARNSMRSVMDEFAGAINWGLTSFEVDLATRKLNTTYAYLMGDEFSMNFSASCNGYQADSYQLGLPFTPGCTSGTLFTDSDGMKKCSSGLRCVKNPEWREAWEGDASLRRFKYITFERSSDDLGIQDVLYFGRYNRTPAYGGIWAPISRNRTATQPADEEPLGSIITEAGSDYPYYSPWASRDNSHLNKPLRNFNPPFSNDLDAFRLEATDAGFIPNSGYTRLLFLPRGWGYTGDITGKGVVNNTLDKGGLGHLGKIKTSLTPESFDARNNAPDLKNAARLTPISGTLETVYNYYAEDWLATDANKRYSCQNHYALLVTDGMPSADNNGRPYSTTERTHDCIWDENINGCQSGQLKKAATDAVAAIERLRTIDADSDGQTDREVLSFVIAMADSVTNNHALSVMDALAYAGGGYPTAFKGTHADGFRDALLRIMENIQRRSGSASALTVQDDVVFEDEVIQASYATNYDSSNWSGNIFAYPKNIDTAVTDTDHPFWSADEELNLQYPLMTGGSKPIRSNLGNRRLATASSTAGISGPDLGIAFRNLANLTSLQQALLKNQQAMLDYLRGASNEENARYRKRDSLLGDIINASPVVVRAPAANYNPDKNPGYKEFVEDYQERINMLYQPANDGFLHAFRAVTDPAASVQDPRDGQELWGYVPNLLLEELPSLSVRGRFIHKMYLDATPVVADVDFNYKGVSNPANYGAADSDWHTLLVGGLGKGGRGFYALDITEPEVQTDSDVAAKVLWEFPNSIRNVTTRERVIKQVGYSFGKPLIIKTKALGWVVVVTSGYNNGSDTNGDGLGHLFFLDPKTGDLLQQLTASGCKDGLQLSCGLVPAVAYMPDTLDPVTDYIYGADLHGQVWRFDLTNGDHANWQVSKMAALKDRYDPDNPDDAGAYRQPVTGGMQVTTVHMDGQDVRFLYLGTGQYLSDEDIPTKHQQSIYALIDKGNADSGLPGPDDFTRDKLQPQRLDFFSETNAGKTTEYRRATSHEVDFDSKNGWYIDLNDASGGERMIRDIKLVNGIVAFPTFIPSTVPCTLGGVSYSNYVNYLSGGLVPEMGITSQKYENGLINAITVTSVYRRDGTLKEVQFDITLDNDTQVVESADLAAYPLPKRMNWREIIR